MAVPPARCFGAEPRTPFRHHREGQPPLTKGPGGDPARLPHLAAPTAGASTSAAVAAEADAGTPAAGAAEDETTGEAAETPKAEALNERLGPWAFRIPEHLYGRLTTARSEWLAKDGTS
jgi:hypothetical protein